MKELKRLLYRLYQTFLFTFPFLALVAFFTFIAYIRELRELIAIIRANHVMGDITLIGDALILRAYSLMVAFTESLLRSR